jgi:SNF2 family DNA or RNA helicase
VQGHIIKSGKTKITQAVKQIQANHRVILSGTPVQVGSIPSHIGHLQSKRRAA